MVISSFQAISKDNRGIPVFDGKKIFISDSYIFFIPHRTMDNFMKLVKTQKRRILQQVKVVASMFRHRGPIA